MKAFIVTYLTQLLFYSVDNTLYHVFSGRPGLFIDDENNLCCDILVYNKEIFPSSKISKHYADVAAESQIEVDITTELGDMTETGYIKRKTDILLEFGTKKVIWIFTATQRVLEAEKDKDWLWINWNKPVQLWKNNSFCIGEYLKQEGVELSEE